MSTIHVHPTATGPAALKRLQARTGLVAVISGHRAELVTDAEFANPSIRKPAMRQGFLGSFTNGDGPSAA